MLLVYRFVTCRKPEVWLQHAYGSIAEKNFRREVIALADFNFHKLVNRSRLVNELCKEMKNGRICYGREESYRVSL